MKRKRLRLPQRVYREKRPAKSGLERTSTGAEVRPVLVAGLTKESNQANREWIELLQYLAKHSRND